MSWFKNLNTMPKLMLSFGLILFFTAAIGLLGVYQISEQTAQYDLLLQRDVAGLVAVQQFEVAKANIATTSRDSIIASMKDNSEQAVDKDERQFNELFARLQSLSKSISSRVDRPESRSITEQITALLPEYEERSRQVFEYARTGDKQGAAVALAKNADLIAKLNSLTIEAGQMKTDVVEGNRAALTKHKQTSESTMLWLMAATVGIGFSLAFFISRNLSIPLIAAVSILEKLSKGDLTQRLTLTSRDEIGKLAESLNSAMDSMDDALADVGTSARHLSSSSQQLARAAEALAAGAQEQAASLEETSASLEQITATVRQNSDSAKHASQLAMSSRDFAEKGGSAAVETVAAMAEIKSSSSKISEIITTIDEIAFQTNLLSVNASVEAARAGIHGNGFKVVATEVRNLAQRSAAAAKEIKSLINGSVRKVENGSTLVANSGSTLKEIVSSVKRVSDIVGEIAAASQEQATGIEQVGKAMIQMDQVTQSNSSQTEELSATAASLASQSTHLRSLVSQFILTSSEPDSPTKSASANPSSFAAPASPHRTMSHPVCNETVKQDASRNLQSMAQNIGHSVLSRSHNQEFEEF